MACGPGSPEVSKSYMDMASKLFTFTFTFTSVEPTCGFQICKAFGHAFPGFRILDPPPGLMRQRISTTRREPPQALATVQCKAQIANRTLLQCPALPYAKAANQSLARTECA